MDYQWPGDKVVETAIYQVLHRRHSLPEQVLLFADDSFPECKVCGDKVHYRLLRRSAATQDTATEQHVRAKAAGKGK
jgi:hypothetical protein